MEDIQCGKDCVPHVTHWHDFLRFDVYFIPSALLISLHGTMIFQWISCCLRWNHTNPLLIAFTNGISANSSPPCAACMRRWSWSALVKIMALSPGRRQDFIWTNADILSTGLQGKYFNYILFEIQISSFKKMRLNMSCTIAILSRTGGRDELN